MHKNRIFIIGSLALGILLGIFFASNFDLIELLHAQENTDNNDAKITQQSSNLIPQQASLADVVDLSRPFVVSITSTRTIKYRTNSPYDHPLFREFFGIPEGSQPNNREFEEKGLGSGVIVRSDGYILTNAHVVDQADEVIVRTEDGKFEAEIIGSDIRSDIAVLKIDTDGAELPCAKIGDSDKLRVGDWVIAIGNPYELAHTVTAGIISAKGRSNVGIVDYEDFLQTDASINPGNSGGALVNLNGELIGINTAIASRTGGFQGIGFAIPVNMAVRVMEQLIENGYVDRGFMGVTLQSIDSDLAEALELETTDGAIISSVLNGSPAEDAGLQRGDIITKLNGESMKSVPEVRNEVSLTSPGTEIALDITRDGKEKVFKFELASMEDFDRGYSYRENKRDLPTSVDLGITVAPLTRAIIQENGLSEGQSGVFITDVSPESAFAEVGIRIGDIILEINKQTIEDIDDYDQAVSDIEQGETNLLLIQRDSNVFYIAVRI